MNYIDEYIREIESGRIKVGKRVYKVYKRLQEESHLSVGVYYFDEARATAPIEFIELFCKQAEGKLGEPIKLELFQKAFISALFGFIRYDNGLRRFRETLLLIARKNGKTTLLAAIGLYMLLADDEGAPEIYSAATKRDQALKTVTAAINMIKQSPELRAVTTKSRSDIFFPEGLGTFKALASDSNTLDGLNVHCAIIDELHAIRDRNLYEVLKQGTSSRDQPLIVMITTAGTVRENIFDEIYEYACKIADGTETDNTFLPILYELDSREEWTDKECWVKANPGLGTIKKMETLEGFVERAQKSPSDRKGVLCKDFNFRETDVSAWLSFEEVESNLTFTMGDIYNTYGIGGCDLSATTDLTCASLLIRKSANDPIVYVLQQYFIPRKKLDALNCADGKGEKEAPYSIWEKRGLLTVCEGNRVNFSDVTAWFCKMRDEYKIDVFEVGYDRALAGYWINEMESNGFTMTAVAQGPFTWSQPMREMGAAFADHKVNYNKNPMLAWCLTNTKAKKTGENNLQPVKINDIRRIDGMVSLLNAWVLYVRKFEDYMYLVG